eukprot:9349442-Lingulodinium_polyedra.AAC.1
MALQRCLASATTSSRRGCDVWKHLASAVLACWAMGTYTGGRALSGGAWRCAALVYVCSDSRSTTP